MDIYSSILSLLLDVFGSAAVVGSVPYATCEVLATIACVFIVAVPFIIVWWTIKAICSIGR